MKGAPCAPSAPQHNANRVTPAKTAAQANRSGRRSLFGAVQILDRIYGVCSGRFGLLIHNRRFLTRNGNKPSLMDKYRQYGPAAWPGSLVRQYGPAAWAGGLGVRLKTRQQKRAPVLWSNRRPLGRSRALRARARPIRPACHNITPAKTAARTQSSGRRSAFGYVPPAPIRASCGRVPARARRRRRAGSRVRPGRRCRPSWAARSSPRSKPSTRSCSRSCRRSRNPTRA